jgi:hypothetical protein
LEFARAFATYIYHNEMVLPGTDFIVTGLEKPRMCQKSVSSDGSRVIECAKFLVTFYDRETKKVFRLDFSCDAGYNPTLVDFDVNALTLSSRGFEALVKGNQVPVLEIIRKIMARKANWCVDPDWHPSAIGRVMKMFSQCYLLYGCPSISETEFCPLLQGGSDHSLEFSGCNCATSSGESMEVTLSLEMLCGYLTTRRNQGPVKCPLCRGNFTELTHEMDRDVVAPFDLSSIGILPPDDVLRELQERSRSFVRIFGLVEEPSEYKDLMKRFLALANVQDPQQSYLPGDLSGLPQDAQIFFRSCDEDPVEHSS